MAPAGLPGACSRADNRPLDEDTPIPGWRWPADDPERPGPRRRCGGGVEVVAPGGTVRAGPRRRRTRWAWGAEVSWRGMSAGGTRSAFGGGPGARERDR